MLFSRSVSGRKELVKNVEILQQSGKIRQFLSGNSGNGETSPQPTIWATLVNPQLQHPRRYHTPSFVGPVYAESRVDLTLTREIYASDSC